MKTVNEIAYALDREECRLDLYLPESSTGKLPLYVAIHGGGLETGTKRDEGRIRMAQCLTSCGIAVASVDYRMYPKACFPDYIEDVAAAIAFLQRDARFGQLAVGGESAGGYITQMLYFNKNFLQNAGADRSRIRAFVMDAGQPTTHFNILKYERGIDSRAVVIDEAAPLYYLREQYSRPENEPYVAIFSADNDMVNRMEQNKMLETAMLHFGFPREKLLCRVFEGCHHCEYIFTSGYYDLLTEFLNRAFSERREKD